MIMEAIDPQKHSQLHTDLRIATSDEELSLDKRVFNGLAWLFKVSNGVHRQSLMIIDRNRKIEKEKE